MPLRPIPGHSQGQDRWGRVPASVLVLALAALAGGWWLGRQMGAPASSPPSSRLALEKQADQLQQRLDLGQADDRDRERLLEVLVGLNRREQATRLLESMADQQPQRWRLRLLLAQLRHDLGDRAGAEREVRQVLHVLPDQIEALQLATRLQLETGRGAEAAAALRQVYDRLTRPQLVPQALPVGLLLADLDRQLGQPAQAEASYGRLAEQFPKDPRPLLALALLKQDQGQTTAAQALLQQARARAGRASEASLNQVATAWGLASLRRQNSPGASAPAATSPGAGPVRVSPPAPAEENPPPASESPQGPR